MSLAKKRREALMAQTGGSDKMKLWLMAGLLIVILAAFVSLKFWGASEEMEDPRATDADSSSEPAIENDSVSNVRTDEDGRLQARATTQTEVLPEFIDVKIDLEKLANVQDASAVGRETIEGGPLDYLLETVLGPAKRKRRGFRRLEAASLADAPDHYRGAAVEFKGRLLGGKDIPYEDRISGVTSIHRGFLQVLPEIGDAEGDPILVSFTCAGRPATSVVSAFEQSEPFEPGDVVRMYGYFLKTWRAARPGTTRAVDTPHVVAQRFVRSYIVTPQTELDPGWFLVGDGDKVDEPMFFLGLNYVRHLTPETYRSRREKEELRLVPIPEPGEPFPASVPDDVVTDFDVRGKLLHDQVKLYQGKLVRVSGTVVRSEPVYPVDNQGGIDVFWKSFLWQGNYVVPLVSPFPLDRYGEGVEDRADVVVEGYYYKRLIWEPAKGDQTFIAPLLLVTDMRPAGAVGDSPLIYAPWVVVGFVVIFVAAMLFMLVRDRKSSQLHEERRRKIRVGVREKGARAPDWSPGGDEK
jgi:hypothetical protein